MSIRQQVAEAVVSFLNGGTKPVGIPEARVRRPNPQGIITSSEINVYFANEGSQLRGNSVYKRTLSLVVECRTVTTDPDEVDTVLEPMLTWVSKSLNGSNSLARLALTLVETGTIWTPFYLERIYSIARTSFVIEYQTSRLDPESHA